MSRKAAPGFGAPSSDDAHRFRLVLARPALVPALAELVEDHGALLYDRPRAFPRARVPLEVWTEVADDVRDEFNKRLVEAGHPKGSWAPHRARLARGEAVVTEMDRMLGKELAVLLWALEGAPVKRAHRAFQRWAALVPAERYWLFWMTIAEGGGPADGGAPWRRAIRAAIGEEGQPG